MQDVGIDVNDDYQHFFIPLMYKFLSSKLLIK